jgi:pimeloyl-ACP methyl ester carboxylesterase
MNKNNLVIIHGWGALPAKFSLLSKELRYLGWNILIPELPGLDTFPPKEAWDLESYSEFLYKRITEVFNGKRFFIFGHSFGGRIAIKLASKYCSGLQGIILCGSGGLSRSSILKRTVFKCMAKMGNILIVVPFAAKVFRKYLYKLAHEHDYEKSEGIMKEIFKKTVSEDLKGTARNINVPVLILWGKLDKMTPVKDAFYLKKVLPSSKMILYDNQGHTLPYTKPKDIAKEINVWAKNLA